MEYDTEISGDVELGRRQQVFTVEAGSHPLTNLFTVETGTVNEGREGPGSSEKHHNYESLKVAGFKNLYHSSTVPIDAGSPRLCVMDEVRDISTEMHPNGTGSENMKLAWCTSPSPTEMATSSFCQRRSSLASSLGGTQQANVRSVIRRLQQRRKALRGGRARNYKCLRFILCILYYIGVSPYRPKRTWKPPKALERLLKVLHWTLVCIAIIATVAELKMRLILFRKGPNMQTLAEMGISVIVTITRIYTVKVFASMKNKMDHLLEEEPETNTKVGNRARFADCKINGFMALMLGISICMALASVFFGSTAFTDWSFEEQQRLRAYGTNEFLAIWAPHNLENVTQELLEKHLDTPVSAQLVMFALVGDIVRYIGDFYDNASVDFWLALAYQVHLMQIDLKHFLEKDDCSVYTTEFDLVWDLYMESRVSCNNINEIFGHLLKLLHVTNALRFADMLLNIMESNLSAWRVNCFISLLKICATYYFCKLSADLSGKVQEHVIGHTDAEGLLEIHGVKMNMLAIRMEMELHPIGLGRGNFFVDETFLIKMLCAAWSVFALFADHSSTCK